MKAPLTAVTAAVTAVLLAGAVPALAAPTPAPSDPLTQRLDPNQGTGHGRVVLSRGHVDIGPREHDGRWSIAIHDDTKSPSLWRAPADTVIDVADAAQLTVPTSPTYRFLGAAAGKKVWVIPQTQNRDVVWTGWNTQDPNVMSALSLGATFTFHGVRGPGDLFVFLQSGLAGTPDQLWSSTNPKPQQLFVETNTHTHANWVFTKPGVYLVDMQISGTLRSGKKVSDRQALRFAVGSATDPKQAFTAAVRTTPGASPSSSATAPAAATGGTAAPPAARGSSSSTVVWVVVPIVAVLLLAGVLVTTLRQRRIRARIHQPDAS